jgi:hypothetical protein
MSFFDDLLNMAPVSRVRRNHGLEHATMHILSARYPRQPMAGHSDTGGFWILGDIPTEDVRDAVTQALARMQNGEENLAVHPNCGTNFVTSGTVAGLAAWLGMLGAGKGARGKLERLPVVISLATLALIFGQPLGFFLQAHVTTSGKPGDLQIVSVNPGQGGGMRSHRIITRG